MAPARQQRAWGTMRFLLVCTALCIAFQVKADPFKLSPHEVSFAYAMRHASAPSAVGLTLDGHRHTLFAPMALSFQARPFSKHNLCSAAAGVATENNLPIPFFANLIEQESGFRPHVVSRAGAQGIAQFMPQVAAAYGLNNPFDPIHALRVSGRFLAELVSQFGNLGLAAAAYNAGPTRVQNWMVRGGKLPSETHHYVQRITGRPIEQWAKHAAIGIDIGLPAHARCPDSKTLEAQAAERAKPSVTKLAAKAKTVPVNALSPDVTTVALAAQRRGAKSQIVVAAGRRGRSLAATGPAAKRFAAMKTPVIVAPEKNHSVPGRPFNAGLTRNGDKSPPNATRLVGARKSTRQVRMAER